MAGAVDPLIEPPVQGFAGGVLKGLSPVGGFDEIVGVAGGVQRERRVEPIFAKLGRKLIKNQAALFVGHAIK